MYKIVITKEEVVKTKKREWEKTADTGNEQDNGPVYDNVYYEAEETKITTMYEQRTENLDLKAVIDAFNKAPQNESPKQQAQ